MLVLTRKNGQKLIINDNIEVIVIESYNNSVKIGIKAPKEVSVYREEVWREIKDVNNVSHETSFKAIDKISQIMQEQKNTTGTKLKTFVTKVNVK